MRYKDFLTEDRGKSTSYDETMDLLRNHCMNAVDDYYKGHKLFRGYYSNKSDYFYIDPKKGKPRRSAYAGKNYYTLLMDNLPSWKNYPKRSQSIICSSKYEKASEYTYSSNNIYIVFPYDRSKIGVAPDDDIFVSFDLYSRYSSGFASGRTFNRFLENLLYHYSDNRNIDKDWNTLKKAFKDFDNNYDNLKSIDSDVIEGFNKTLILNNYKGNIIKMFDKIMSPTANNFKLVTDISKIPDNRECWTDGKCVLIKASLIEDVLDNINPNKTFKYELEETDNPIDYIDNVKCTDILFLTDTMRNAYTFLDYYINKNKRLTDILHVWELSKPEQDFLGKKYFAFDMDSYISVIKNIFLKKNVVNISIAGTGYSDYSMVGGKWEFKPSMKYKNLEEIIDIETLDNDYRELKRKKLI